MKRVIGKILLIVLPIIIAGWVLYPTYKASNLEKMESSALKKAIANPKDSASIMDEFYKSYGTALEANRNSKLKLGLDLRGGMYATLEVDVAQLIEESASDETKDAIFKEVMDKTRSQAKLSDESAIDLFLKNFDEIARPKKKYLADYFEYGANNADLTKTEEIIVKKLKENESDAIEQAMQVIRQRIDQYGVAEPNLQKQGNRRIMIELPGVTDEAKMIQFLKTSARLEFKSLANDKKLAQAFYNIDKHLAKLAKSGDAPVIDTNTVKPDSTKVVSDSTNTNVATKTDSANTAAADTANPYANLSKEETAKRYTVDHPFTTLFISRYAQNSKSQSQEMSYINSTYPEGEYMFMADEKSMGKIILLLKRPDVQMLLPEDIKIHFDAKPEMLKDNKGKDIKFFNFYACKDFQPKLTGDVIEDAGSTYDPTNNRPVVNMVMNSEGAERWSKITGANIGKRVAIILDDKVYTAPVVQSRITGGNSQISGMADAEEARLLKIVLKAGALKAPVQTAEVRVVGPSLGEDSINDGMTASAIAFGLVILFMIVYYRTGGVIADLAVLINVLLIMAVLASFKATLTLPGIAGIILTIGMAVDANILIYERIREEIYRGRSLRAAVDEGFKKALTAILDSNITTFITGLILYYFGTGPIQGFAMTLMIGILATLFTAIIVSKAMIEIMMKPGSNHFNFGQPKITINDEVTGKVN